MPTKLADMEGRLVESFDASQMPNARVAEVHGFDPAKYLGDKGLRTPDRPHEIARGRHTSRDGRRGLQEGRCAFVVHSPDRVGICSSNAYGSLEAVTELDRVAR
ncbi:MAG: hypothetical protein U0169_24625 [Polyangiaceae bacterium]